MNFLYGRFGKLYYLLFDSAILAAVPFLALLLRLDGDVTNQYFSVLINVFAAGVIIKLAVLPSMVCIIVYGVMLLSRTCLR